MPKPDITRLLIDSALHPELRARLRETPEEVFAEYDLTAEEREILRCPDHRLLPLLGAALGRREEAERSVEPERAEAPERAERRGSRRRGFYPTL